MTQYTPQPGDHLCALREEGKTFRDEAHLGFRDEEMERILNGKPCPPGFVIYHYSNPLQWAEVLKLPVYYRGDQMNVRTQIEVLNSDHGICRRCRMQPADGLFQGRYPIMNDFGGLIRTSPYKGYVCEQCAQGLEEETETRGRWL